MLRRSRGIESMPIQYGHELPAPEMSLVDRIRHSAETPTKLEPEARSLNEPTVSGDALKSTTDWLVRDSDRGRRGGDLCSTTYPFEEGKHTGSERTPFCDDGTHEIVNEGGGQVESTPPQAEESEFSCSYDWPTFREDEEKLPRLRSSKSNRPKNGNRRKLGVDVPRLHPRQERINHMGIAKNRPKLLSEGSELQRSCDDSRFSRSMRVSPGQVTTEDDAILDYRQTSGRNLNYLHPLRFV